jgi:uncharacterized coiled-coil protein SlyX
VTTMEGRLAFLEGTVGEHSHMLNGIRDAMTSLEARMDRRFEQMDKRFEQLEQRMDGRFAQMDARFVQIDARFIQMESRFSQVDQRFESLDAKMSRQFVWLVGILVTALVAVLGVLGTITGALLSGWI